jgi:hypothetical protein
MTLDWVVGGHNRICDAGNEAIKKSAAKSALSGNPMEKWGITREEAARVVREERPEGLQRLMFEKMSSHPEAMAMLQESAAEASQQAEDKKVGKCSGARGAWGRPKRCRRVRELDT